MRKLSRRNVIKAAGAGLAAVAAGPLARLAIAEGPAPAKPVTVTLYNTGDMHDHSGSLPRIAGFVKQQKAKDPNVLLVDAGDVWNKGETQMAATGGMGMVHMMQLAGYDAATCGNHDYIGGADRLLKVANKYPGWGLTLCNVDWEDDQKKLAEVIPPFRVFDFKGVKISISGGACQYFNHCHGRKPKLIHERDGYKHIRPKVVAAADVHVYITHLWNAYDRRMIMCWGEGNHPDVLVGGHTHERKIWKQDRVHIIKAGFWGRWLGKTVITWDPAAKKILSIKQGVLDVRGDWPVDKDVQAARDEYFKPRKKTTVVSVMGSSIA